MTAGRHRLDGQRRDALRAWLRSLARLIPPILTPRRDAPRAAGGATGPTPVAGAPEAPAPDFPVPGAGASPELPRPGDPPRAHAARSGPGQQPPDAAPEGVTAPAAPGAAARPPWVTWHGPPGTPPPAPRIAPGRDTIAMPAVDAALRVRYAAAHEQERDRAANQ